MIAITNCVCIFHALMEVVKCEHISVFPTALRHGRAFIEAFLRYLPFFSANFVELQEKIRQALSLLQRGTRLMQISKLLPCVFVCFWNYYEMKDSSLILNRSFVLMEKLRKTQS
jgi:hypothetical protein